MLSVRWIFICQISITISSVHAEDLLYEESDPDLFNLEPSSIFNDDLLAFNEPNVGPLDDLAPNLLDYSDWPTGAAVNVDDGTNFAMLDTSTPDLFATDLGNADSTYSISTDDGFETASSTCSAPHGGLGRRELSVCPADRPDLEYELRFAKTGERFFFMSGNPAICGMFEMCPGCLYAVCDSGEEADRIPTSVPLVYDLNNASPCNSQSHVSDVRFLIPRAVDLAKGCFFPHDVWCCGNPFFGDFEDHNLLSYVR